MKSLKIKRLDIDDEKPALEKISRLFDELGQGYEINQLPWKDFSYQPDVRFNIAYGEKELYLKYYVTENYIRAKHDKSNQMVCEDSCVEFFVSPSNDGVYYNFEFNCIGTCLLGKGRSRKKSKVLDPGVIEGIRRISTLGNQPFEERSGKFYWELTIAIPLESFTKHKLSELKGKKFRANFYKCGDKLSEMHYLTWNRVKTNNPDFHQPAFFGEIEFC